MLGGGWICRHAIFLKCSKIGFRTFGGFGPLEATKVERRVDPIQAGVRRSSGFFRRPKPFPLSYRKRLLSLKQAIPAAGKSELCNAERQKWVMPMWAPTADAAPELHKTIGRLVSIHIVDGRSYEVASTGSAAFEFAEETGSSGFLETV